MTSGHVTISVIKARSERKCIMSGHVINTNVRHAMFMNMQAHAALSNIGSRNMQAFMTVGGHICMAGRTQAIA